MAATSVALYFETISKFLFHRQKFSIFIVRIKNARQAVNYGIR